MNFKMRMLEIVLNSIFIVSNIYIEEVKGLICNVYFGMNLFFFEKKIMGVLNLIFNFFVGFCLFVL